MAHIVTAPAVQITVAGRTHFLERDAFIPDGVAPEILDRLISERLISEFEVLEIEEIPIAAVFTQAEVDALVEAAAGVNAAELKQARQAVEVEAESVVRERAELDRAKAEFESEKHAAVKAAAGKPSAKPGQ